MVSVKREETVVAINIETEVRAIEWTAECICQAKNDLFHLSAKMREARRQYVLKLAPMRDDSLDAAAYKLYAIHRMCGWGWVKTEADWRAEDSIVREVFTANASSQAKLL